MVCVTLHFLSTKVNDYDGHYIFFQAVEIGNIDLVKIFWDYKLDKSQTDFNGNTALHLAVTYGFYKIVDLLVQNSTLVNRPNDVSKIMYFCAMKNSMTLIFILVGRAFLNFNLR